MMNLAPNDMPAPIGRVQEVPLGQEMLQCPAARKKSLANGAIPALKRSRQSSAMRPLALVLNPSSQDRKSTRLNSSHITISYAVFCLKKKKKKKKYHYS